MARRRGNQYITKRKVGRRRRTVQVTKLPDGRESVRVINRLITNGEPQQQYVNNEGLAVESPIITVRVGKDITRQPMELTRFTEETARRYRKERKSR